MKMSIRCTPFCAPCDRNCKHSDLLVALLNTTDDEVYFSPSAMEKEIEKLEKRGWKRDDEIQEEDKKFQFPLIHWACVLGKTRTVKWLIKNGFSPTAQKQDTLETCLHRTLMTIPEMTSVKSGRDSVLRFDTILPHLKECLTVGNYRQDLPLHVAAHFMGQNKCYSLYENLFMAMLGQVMKMSCEERLKCLNACNSAGDTVLNILSSSGKSLTVIEKLLTAGADCMIVNKLSIGPLANAEKEGLAHIANFLKSFILQAERKHLSFTHMGNPDCTSSEESRTLRSGRKGPNCKSSEKNIKPLATDLIIPIVVESDADVESSSHASHECLEVCTSIANPIPTAVIPPTSRQVETYMVTINERCTTLENKTDLEMADFDQLCDCCEESDYKYDSLPNDSVPRNVEAEVTQEESQDKLFDAMKEAGVLPSLANVIENTKEGHLSRIKDVERCLSELERNRQSEKEQQRKLKIEIRKKQREMESLRGKLTSSVRRENRSREKRSLLEDEREDLKKKMLCCESLLKKVE